MMDTETVDMLRTFGKIAWALCAVIWATWAGMLWWAQGDTVLDPTIFRSLSKSAFRTTLLMLPVGVFPIGLSWEAWWFITSTIFLPMFLAIAGTWLGTWAMAVTLERQQAAR
jgi:hypothetical protein